MENDQSKIVQDLNMPDLQKHRYKSSYTISLEFCYSNKPMYKKTYSYQVRLKVSVHVPLYPTPIVDEDFNFFNCDIVGCRLIIGTYAKYINLSIIESFVLPLDQSRL